MSDSPTEQDGTTAPRQDRGLLAWLRRALARLERIGEAGRTPSRTRLLAKRLLPPTPRANPPRPADRLEQRLEEWLADTRLAYTLAGD